MHNAVAVNYITKNYKSLKRIWANTFSDEAREDAIHELMITFMNPNSKIISDTKIKAYVEISLKKQLTDYKKRHARIIFMSPLNENNLEPNALNTAQDPNDVIQDLQDHGDVLIKLAAMHEHILSLPEKQQSAVNDFLYRDGSSAHANFKQAMRKLRDVMGGKLHKVIPGGYKPKYTKRGVQGKLTTEQVLEIRRNVVTNSKGELINKLLYAEKFNVTPQVIYMVAKRKKYLSVPEEQL